VSDLLDALLGGTTKLIRPRLVAPASTDTAAATGPCLTFLVSEDLVHETLRERVAPLLPIWCVGIQGLPAQIKKMDLQARRVHLTASFTVCMCLEKHPSWRSPGSAHCILFSFIIPLVGYRVRCLTIVFSILLQRQRGDAAAFCGDAVGALLRVRCASKRGSGATRVHVLKAECPDQGWSYTQDRYSRLGRCLAWLH
jgi:hypothetical protein